MVVIASYDRALIGLPRLKDTVNRIKVNYSSIDLSLWFSPKEKPLLTYRQSSLTKKTNVASVWHHPSDFSTCQSYMILSKRSTPVGIDTGSTHGKIISIGQASAQKAD